MRTLALLLVGHVGGFPVEEIAKALHTVSQYASECPADTFVDPSNPANEHKSARGNCAWAYAETPACPTGWAKRDSAWEWCSWGRHRYDTSCAACSVQRRVLSKQTLTTCDISASTPCWLGFKANDLPSTVSSRFGGL